jgi:hypothetical protein
MTNRGLVAVGLVLLSALVPVFACGSFEGAANDGTDAAPSVDAVAEVDPFAEGSADAGADAHDAADANDAAACIPAPATCAADAGSSCVTSDFLGKDAGAWELDPASIGQPTYLNDVVSFSSNGFAQLRRVVLTPSSPFAFRFAFQVRIVASGSGPGPIVFAGIRGSVNESFALSLKADGSGKFTLCQGVSHCADVGAFAPNTWHHIEWTGALTQNSVGGTVGISVDCKPTVELALVKPIYESANALYFGAGLTSVGTFNLATVEIDDLILTKVP